MCRGENCHQGKTRPAGGQGVPRARGRRRVPLQGLRFFLFPPLLELHEDLKSFCLPPDSVSELAPASIHTVPRFEELPTRLASVVLRTGLRLTQLLSAVCETALALILTPPFQPVPTQLRFVLQSRGCSLGSSALTSHVIRRTQSFVFRGVC